MIAAREVSQCSPWAMTMQMNCGMRFTEIGQGRALKHGRTRVQIGLESVVGPLLVQSPSSLSFFYCRMRYVMLLIT